MKYGDRKTVFAWLPVDRWVRIRGHIEKDGCYWWRRVVMMKTIWNGWTAYADEND